MQNFNLDSRAIKQIEYILPRLKYSVYIGQVTRWLENFDKNETENALDLLFFLEYITSAELQQRIDEQLKSLILHFGTDKTFVFTSFSEYPKSNDIVLYLLSKLQRYKSLAAKKKALITKDILSYKYKNNTVVVFVDDFIGTGNSFAKWYKKNKFYNKIGANSEIHHEQALLAAIIMEKAIEQLSIKFPEISIFAQQRNRIFDKRHSPLRLTGNLNQVRNLCIKHGSKLITRYSHRLGPIATPLGYENTESLIAFEYGTPNNTISIIWGEAKWKPIFPRMSKLRMENSNRIKEEAAFLVGLIHKLKIPIKKENYKSNSPNSIFKPKEEFSILIYINLKERNYSDIEICQIIGITLNELKKIKAKTAKANLCDRQGNLTKKALTLILELKKQKNIRFFRENDSLEVRNTIFVPKTFRKMS